MANTIYDQENEKNEDGFEMFKDHKNEWRWRFFSNGRITADSGEGYKNEEDCKSALSYLINNASRSNIRIIRY